MSEAEQKTKQIIIGEIDNIHKFNIGFLQHSNDTFGRTKPPAAAFRVADSRPFALLDDDALGLILGPWPRLLPASPG